MAGYMMGEYMAGIQGVFPAGLPAASKGFFPRVPKPFEARDVSYCLIVIEAVSPGRETCYAGQR